MNDAGQLLAGLEGTLTTDELCVGDVDGLGVGFSVKLVLIWKVILSSLKSLLKLVMLLLRLNVTIVSFSGVFDSIRNVISEENPV